MSYPSVTVHTPEQAAIAAAAFCKLAGFDPPRTRDTIREQVDQMARYPDFLLDLYIIGAGKNTQLASIRRIPNQRVSAALRPTNSMNQAYACHLNART